MGSVCKENSHGVAKRCTEENGEIRSKIFRVEEGRKKIGGVPAAGLEGGLGWKGGCARV